MLSDFTYRSNGLPKGLKISSGYKNSETVWRRNVWN